MTGVVRACLPLGAELVAPDAVVLGAAGVECRRSGRPGESAGPGRRARPRSRDARVENSSQSSVGCRRSRRHPCGRVPSRRRGGGSARGGGGPCRGARRCGTATAAPCRRAPATSRPRSARDSATSTWVCSCGSPARLDRCTNAAATNPSTATTSCPSTPRRDRQPLALEPAEGGVDRGVVRGADLPRRVGISESPQHRHGLGCREREVESRDPVLPGLGEPGPGARVTAVEDRFEGAAADLTAQPEVRRRLAGPTARRLAQPGVVVLDAGDLIEVVALLRRERSWRRSARCARRVGHRGCIGVQELAGGPTGPECPMPRHGAENRSRASGGVVAAAMGSQRGRVRWTGVRQSVLDGLAEMR